MQDDKNNAIVTMYYGYLDRIAKLEEEYKTAKTLKRKEYYKGALLEAEQARYALEQLMDGAEGYDPLMFCDIFGDVVSDCTEEQLLGMYKHHKIHIGFDGVHVKIDFDATSFKELLNYIRKVVKETE